ncbi:MAG TPA: MliC family protein [Rhizobiaceae bacterium]
MRIFVKAAPAALALLAGMTGQALSIDARYTCSGGVGLEASFSEPGVSPEGVVLTFADAGEIALPRVVSADGVRYAEGDVEFWIKGDSATLTRNGKTGTCHARWVAK